MNELLQKRGDETNQIIFYFFLPLPPQNNTHCRFIFMEGSHIKCSTERYEWKGKPWWSYILGEMYVCKLCYFGSVSKMRHGYISFPRFSWPGSKEMFWILWYFYNRRNSNSSRLLYSYACCIIILLCVGNMDYRL